MELTSNKIWCDPLFLLGLGVRLIFIFLVIPKTQTDWFIPFIMGFVDSPSLDPWTSHLLQGGDKLSFPYGAVMLVFYYPLSLVATSLNSIVHSEILFGISFGLSNLAADLIIFFLLRDSLNRKTNSLYFYWLSPLVIYINYWLGHLDLVPIGLLVASFVMIKKINPLASGALMGLALSAS